MTPFQKKVFPKVSKLHGMWKTKEYVKLCHRDALNQIQIVGNNINTYFSF